MGGAVRAVKNVGQAVTHTAGDIAGHVGLGGIAKPIVGLNDKLWNMISPEQKAMAGGGEGDPIAKGYTDANGNYVSPIEAESGIRSPGYEGTRDKQGNLKAGFKYDPYQGEMTQKLKAEATGTGPSPWAQMQLQNQGLEQQNARDQAVKSGQQALSMGNANMMRFGGQQNGARERMGAQSMRDIMGAQQDVSRQGIASRGAITAQDLQRKQDLTGQLAGQEGQAQAANIGAMTTDVSNLAQFNANKYAQQMQAYGAAKSADAQRAAASQSGGKK